MFGTSLPINLIRGSIVLLYVDILGMDVRAYAAVMIVYAVVDAVDNPVLGHLSDRTRSRFGRRRPWLLVGAPLLAASTIALFSPPAALDGTALVAWFAVFAILSELFDSMLNANYGALLPELFPEERRRALANVLRQAFQLVAMVISLALTPVLTTSLLGTEDSTEGFSRTALLYALVAVAAITVMALGAREELARRREARPRLLPSLGQILRTRLLWMVALPGVCYGSAVAIVLSGVQLYVRHTLGLPVASAFLLQGVVLLSCAGALAGWLRVVRRLGALRTWRLAFWALTGSFALLHLARDLPTALAAGVVLGAGWAGLLATHDLVALRVLDRDAARHGLHREGLFLSVRGAFGRLNGAVSGLALASLGLLFGYYSGDRPGPDPGEAFRTYLTVYPFALCALGAIAAHLVRVPSPEESAAAAAHARAASPR
jgi:GPH family glycoside/pentoside/hexuronide:cation symporter